jgi:hypothetical protein
LIYLYFLRASGFQWGSRDAKFRSFLLFIDTRGRVNSRQTVLRQPGGLKHLDVVLLIERPNRRLYFHVDRELTLKLKLETATT